MLMRVKLEVDGIENKIEFTSHIEYITSKTDSKYIRDKEIEFGKRNSEDKQARVLLNFRSDIFTQTSDFSTRGCVKINAILKL